GAKIAGLKFIPYLLRDITDETALEIQMKENLNRLEPDPLDEAYSFKYLMEHYNLSPADIAGKFGRTESLVLRRLKLNELTKEAVADMEAGFLPLGQAEEIALFPPEVQKDVLKSCIYKYNDKNYGAEPLDKCRKRIVENIVLNLPNAVFDPTATNLREDGLACINCEKRTGFTPKLFDAEITLDDHCLDKKCFKGKEAKLFSIKREGFQSEFKTEKPLIVSRGYIYDQKNYGEAEFDTYVEALETAECENSKPALSVDKQDFGKTVYICNEDDCPVHQEIDDDDEDYQPSARDLQNQEKKFRIRLNNTVAETVISQAGESFDPTNPFWVQTDLVRRLLGMVLNQYSFRDNAERFINQWEGCPKNLYDDKQRADFLNSLPIERIDQLLFFCTVGKLDYSHWDLVNQDGIRELAKSFTEIDYDLLFAEKLFELAPEESKSLAESYLEKIKAGEAAEIPAFWWTEEAQAKFEAEDREDDEDDENYEDDDDDDLEEDLDEDE
ncbi:MAG TPA: hypothetical protein PKY82_22690, partial [Pyrinomonadaceae bacterium]|nr:hypothetical protein [Pyrinomonadaceae bacterium]